MGIQVDPIGLNNVNLMRYVRPNTSSVQRTRRCLFGRPDPDQNKRIYETSADNERNRFIERYGFDPVKSEFVEIKEVDKVDKNETVNIDKNIQQCLDNVVVKQSEDNANDVNDVDVNDVIKYKIHLKDHVPRQLIKRPREGEHKKTGKYFYYYLSFGHTYKCMHLLNFTFYFNYVRMLCYIASLDTIQCIIYIYTNTTTVVNFSYRRINLYIY